MKKKLMVLAIAGAALGAMIAPAAAFAASDNALEPGVPGDRNCVGQTNSWLAQLVQNEDATDVYKPGLGNAAELFALSTKEWQELVRAYCAGENGA